VEPDGKWKLHREVNIENVLRLQQQQQQQQKEPVQEPLSQEQDTQILKPCTLARRSWHHMVGLRSTKMQQLRRCRCAAAS
jgi:hypothetical protein